MPAGLASAGRSTGRAELGARQRVAIETATQAGRPTVTDGRAGTAVGANADVDADDEAESEAEGEVVTLNGLGRDRVGVPVELPAHAVASAMQATITTTPGRLTPRAWRQEGPGSRGPRSVSAVPLRRAEGAGPRVASQQGVADGEPSGRSG